MRRIDFIECKSTRRRRGVPFISEGDGLLFGVKLHSKPQRRSADRLHRPLARRIKYYAPPTTAIARQQGPHLPIFRILVDRPNSIERRPWRKKSVLLRSLI